MEMPKIVDAVRDIIPNATYQECGDLIQAMLEILEGIQEEANDKYPSMNKWIDDSFQMVRELTKEFYGREVN